MGTSQGRAQGKGDVAELTWEATCPHPPWDRTRLPHAWVLAGDCHDAGGGRMGGGGGVSGAVPPWVAGRGGRGDGRSPAHLMGILNSCCADTRKRLRASWGW